MHNDLPEYFSIMKPTLPTVCRRYEIRAPVFHLPELRVLKVFDVLCCHMEILL